MADYSDMTNLLQGMPGGQPARPYTPRPSDLPSRMEADVMDALYGPEPLPSWIPPNVQNYINNAPSFAEGQRQTIMPPSITRGGEPYSETPQIGDIQRLFQGRITQNAPTSDQPGIRADQFRALMQLPGFSGFTGGTEI